MTCVKVSDGDEACTDTAAASLPETNDSSSLSFSSRVAVITSAARHLYQHVKTVPAVRTKGNTQSDVELLGIPIGTR